MSPTSADPRLPSGQIDERPISGPHAVRQRPRLVAGTNRRIEAMPGRREGHVPHVIGLGGIGVQVQEGRFQHEVGSIGAPCEWWSARFDHEGVEGLPHRSVRPLDLVEERRPCSPIGRWVAGRHRGNREVAHLGGLAGHDPDPRDTRRGQSRKGDDVVLHHHVRLEVVDDAAQPVVHVARPVDQGLPRGRHELAELLDRGLPEDRRRVPDEIDPELARDLLGRRGRPEAHQAFLEPLALEPPGE